MVRVKKTNLANLQEVYAISVISFGGRRFCIAASEKENGPALLIHPQSGDVYTVWDSPGGVMAVLPVPGEMGAVLSIDKFYPVFRSEKAEITHTVLRFEKGRLVAVRTKLADLPYVHRIGLVHTRDGLYLAGGTLCAAKEFAEDWSRPGGVWVAPYRGPSPVRMEKICDGLVKNHGMYISRGRGCDTLHIGAEQGAIAFCCKGRGRWESRIQTGDAVGDLCFADIDGDGQDEMLTIQGFHGSFIAVYHREGERFRSKETLPLDFGHVLWAGQFCGTPCVIGGSRGGDKALTLYLVAGVGAKAGIRFEAHTIDRGVGTAQIAVEEMANGLRVYAANHGVSTVDRYDITDRALPVMLPSPCRRL